MTGRVFLVDDHEIVRRGLTALMLPEPDMVVVGGTGNLASARRTLPKVEPDLVILEIRLPDGSGIELIREMPGLSPDTRCLVLTSRTDDESLFRAIAAGALGCLRKDMPDTDLLRAIRVAATGRSLVDPDEVERAHLNRGSAESRERRLANLTQPERRILDLVAQGLTNRQIGLELHLAEKTVKNYVSAVLSKLGLERRTQAAIMVTTSRML